MLRPALRTWAAFAACLVVLVGAVGWLSMVVLRVSARERATRARADFEADVRLALWRMDAAASALVARESAHPASHYHEVYWSRSVGGEPVELPSPLAADPGARVLLSFEISADGVIRSPQAPEPEAAARLHLAADGVARAQERLARLRGMVDYTQLGGALPAALASRRMAASAADVPAARVEQTHWQTKNSAEYAMRSQSVDKASGYFRLSEENDAADEGAVVARGEAGAMANGWADAAVGALTPVWVGGELVLARRVVTADGAVVQGVWVDWPGLRDELVGSVRDLLPDAALLPAGAEAPPDRRMASLPAVVAPGPLPAAGGRGPVGLALSAAWVAVALAVAAVVVLLVGTLSLSERRAAFVTAVTHELRTPTTTLKTYSEMLVNGRVREPEKQQRYLATLQREAGRLGHLIENVLGFAQLERGRQSLRGEPVDVAEVIERAAPRLRERAAEAGLAVEIEVEGAEAGGLRAAGDRDAVERILFNLVDNASKYAAGADDKRIEISARRDGDEVRVRVADFGPGIPAAARRKLFTPFAKTAQEAAVSAPGVGLGLALCHRLARQMGGKLALEESGEAGTAFLLSLPAKP